MNKLIGRVEVMMLNGKTKPEIAATTGLPPRTTDDYIARVRLRWEAAELEDRPHRRAVARRRLHLLRSRLEKVRAWIPLVRCEGLLLDIDGLRSRGVDVAVTGLVTARGLDYGTLGFRDPDDARARIDELRARLLNGGPKHLQFIDVDSPEDPGDLGDLGDDGGAKDAGNGTGGNGAQH